MTRTELEIIATALGPVVRDYVTATLAEVATHVQVVETQLAGLVTATTEVGVMRERLAALETQPPVPGPPGPPGPDGPPGPPGKDGAPGLEYCGVFADGQVYNVGQIVTAGGSAWHCNEATATRPGDGAKAWTLMVKRGRDYGKDGKA